MKTIAIITIALLYGTICFSVWAIIYVGTGGHAEKMRRKSNNG